MREREETDVRWIGSSGRGYDKSHVRKGSKITNEERIM